MDDMAVERQYVFSGSSMAIYATQCSACPHHLLAAAHTWRLLGMHENWRYRLVNGDDGAHGGAEGREDY